MRWGLQHPLWVLVSVWDPQSAVVICCAGLPWGQARISYAPTKESLLTVWSFLPASVGPNSIFSVGKIEHDRKESWKIKASRNHEYREVLSNYFSLKPEQTAWLNVCIGVLCVY